MEHLIMSESNLRLVSLIKWGKYFHLQRLSFRMPWECRFPPIWEFTFPQMWGLMEFKMTMGIWIPLNYLQPNKGMLCTPLRILKRWSKTNFTLVPCGFCSQWMFASHLVLWIALCLENKAWSKNDFLFLCGMRSWVQDPLTMWMLPSRND